MKPAFNRENTFSKSISCIFILVSLLFFFSILVTQAQTIKITGQVVDTTKVNKVHNAVVMALRFSDSLMVKFTRTDVNGKFEINSLPVDTYNIVASHAQFGDVAYIVIGKPNDTVVNFGKMVLPAKSISLNEVVVYGYTDPIFMKGDTLVYTVDSFKVRENAVVEDLLKKLPGIKVDANGKIFTQGKEVDQVLVDGDEFFGSDITVATKNLAASSVDQVQVYDKKNDAQGESDKETLKVLNLKLKEDAKKGYFGKASAAGDFQKYYEGEFLFNRFKGSQKISAFALTSNTPRSSLGWRDMWDYGFTDDMNMSSGDDGETYFNWNNNDNNGVPRTLKTGVYFNDKILPKTKLNLSYTFTNGDVTSKSSTFSQYFLSDSSYNAEYNYQSFQETQAHRANITIKQTIDSLTDLEVKSNIKINSGSKEESTMQKFSQSNSDIFRSNSIENKSQTSGTDLGVEARLIRNFTKRDRKLVMSYSYNGNDADGTGYLFNEDDNFIDSTLNDTINQQKLKSNKKRDNSFSVSYVEPITKKIRLDWSYDYTSSILQQNKKSFDAVNGNYSQENDLLTSNYTNARTINRGSMGVTYEVKKMRVSVGSKVRQIYAVGDEQRTNYKLTQTVTNLLPYIQYRYKFGENTSLQMKYNTNAKQPELFQLQPVQDNANTNNIYIGNPNLLPSYSHRFNMNYYMFKPISGRNYYINGNYTLTNNSITNAIIYGDYGKTITQPVNTDANYSYGGYAGGSINFFDQKFEVNPGVSFDGSKINSIVNTNKNITRNLTTGAELELALRLDSFEFAISTSQEYTQTSSTVSDRGNSNFFTRNYRASLSKDFKWKFTFETDAEFNTNTQRAQGYNVNFILWNASISKKFGKGENLIASFVATDMLNQNINTYRTVEDNVISDVKNTIIGRYLLLKVVYKFKNKGAEKEDDEE